MTHAPRASANARSVRARLDPGSDGDALGPSAVTRRLRNDLLESDVDHGVELAERFVDEFERVSALIGERPKLNAEVEPSVRRALLRGFPYSLVYAVEPDRVVVLAVMHHKRRPGYWRERGR